MIEYVAALAFVSAFVAVMGPARLRICAAVIAGNFAANEAFVRWAIHNDPWIWFSLTDFAAAVLLCKLPTGRLGAILAATYATQLLMHWSYVLAVDASEDRYLDSLTAMAALQLLLLFGGGANASLRRLRKRGVFSSVPLSTPAHHRGSEPQGRDGR